MQKIDVHLFLSFAAHKQFFLQVIINWLHLPNYNYSTKRTDTNRRRL